MRGRLRPLVWALAFLTVAFAGIALSSGFLEDSYSVNEQITINVSGMNATRLTVQSPTKILNAAVPVTGILYFTPREPGEFLASLYQGDIFLTKDSFIAYSSAGSPLLVPEGDVPADSFQASKKEYKLGEQVVLVSTAIFDQIKISGPKNYLSTKTATKTAFTPLNPGTYVATAYFKGKEVGSASFTIIGSDTQSISPAIIDNPDKNASSLSSTEIVALRIKNSKNKTLEISDLIAKSTILNQREITINNSKIKRIIFENINVHANQGTDIGIDYGSNDKILLKNKRVLSVYGIDTGNLNFSSADVTVLATGKELYKCKDWNFTEQKCLGDWKYVMDLIPGREYHITLSPGDPGYAETGVASINTRKPLYHRGEVADVIMVVLDSSGYLVDDALVDLTVTDPEGTVYSYSTTHNDIVETSKGVYEANFGNTGLSGNYSLFVSAAGANVNSTMYSYFSVQDYYDFEIMRETPVTIDPWKGPFESRITIDSYNFTGLFDFTEVLPLNFIVNSAPGASVTVVNGSTHVTWNNLENNSVVTYTAQAPLVTPDLYSLGPSFVSYDRKSFMEARPWYLAVDPSNNYVPTSTTSEGWNFGTGTTHLEIDEGAVPNTADYVSELVNNGGFSEFGFNPVTETGITSMTLYVYTATGSNAAYTFYLQQSGTTRCSLPIAPGTAQGWRSCTWAAPSGSYATMTLELGPATKSGGGANTQAYVYSSYLRVNYNGVPQVTLSAPNNKLLQTNSVKFNFSVTDDTTPISSCTLWTNFFGAWAANNSVSSVANNTLTSITVNGINDGSYVWNVRCVDSLGASDFGDSNYSVKINAVPPAIQNLAFNTSIINQSDTIRFNASIIDSFGIDYSYITLRFPSGSKTNYSLASSGNEHYVVLTDTTQLGTYNITYIWANDSLGQANWNSAPGKSFQVTASPPALFDILTPAHNTESNNLRPTFTWEQTSDPDFDNYTLQVDNNPGFGSPDWLNYTFLVSQTSAGVSSPLTANTILYWRVIAYDSFGNSRISTNNFTYITDTLAPSIALHNPQNGIYKTSSPVLFNYTPAESNTLSTCKLYGNFSGVWANVDNDTSPDKNVPNNFIRALGEGTYSWNVWCNDSASNHNFAASNYTFKLDLLPPSVNLMTPGNNTLENTTNNVVFTANATDTMSSISSCSLIINNVVEQTRGSIVKNVPFNFTELVLNGDYNWSVNCTDARGFVGASPVHNLSVLVIDSDPPIITPNYPGQGDFTSISDITFNYTPEDASGIENCSLYFDGTYNQTNDTVQNFFPNYFSLSGLTEGVHNWSVQCYDTHMDHNLGFSAVNAFTIDLTNPIVGLTSPNNDNLTSSSVTFNYTVNDTNLDSCTLYGNFSGSWSPDLVNSSPANGQSNLFVRTVNDGSYIWNVLCDDSSGRTDFNDQNYSFIVDTTPPAYSNIVIDPASPAVFSPSQKYTFNITWTDIYGVDTVIIESNFSGSITNNSVTTIGNIYSFNTTGLGAGTYAYKWYANDTHGLWNNTPQYTYTVTKAASSIDLLLNSNDGNISVVEDSLVNMTAVLNTPSTGNVKLYYQGGLTKQGASPLTNLTVFTTPGTYNITAVYSSTANYSASSDTHFVKVNDTRAPHLYLITPAPDTTVGSLSVSFWYNVSDVSNIKNCSIFIDEIYNYTDDTITKNTPQSFTVEFVDGTYNWSVLCYDIFGNFNQSETRNFSVQETTGVKVNITTDKQSYEQGEPARITSITKDEFGNNLNSNVTLDIITGNSSNPWYNTSWNLRKPIFINETKGQKQTNEVVRVNVSGLNGNIQDCTNELRIIHSPDLSEIPFKVLQGDDVNWCYVTFMANITANAVNENYYDAYYNNSAAPSTNYDVDTTAQILYNAKIAANDEGSPVNAANIVGKNDATSATISLSGGGGSAESAHGRDLINVTPSSTILDVLVRYRYAVTSMVGNWYLRYSVNGGGAYFDSYTGISTAVKTTSAWSNITSAYAPLTWTALNNTRLQGRVDKPGGGGTSTMELYWVEMNVTYDRDPITTEINIGQEQKHIFRTANATGTDAIWIYYHDTINMSFENYSAIGRAVFEGLNAGANSSQFEIRPDTTAPNVTLIDPQDMTDRDVGLQTYSYYVFDYRPISCTLFLGPGSLIENETDTSPTNNATNTFINIPMNIGNWTWNVNCTDSAGNTAFALNNRTILVGAPHPVCSDSEGNGTWALISWDAISGADSYNIRITDNLSAGFPSTPNITGITDAFYNDTNASQSATRFYEISTVKNGNEAIRPQSIVKITDGLLDGLNFISIPVNLSTLLLENGTNNGYSFPVSPSCIVSLWTYNGSSFFRSDWVGNKFVPGGGSESFTSLDHLRGYWLETNNNCSITYCGRTPMENFTKSVSAGVFAAGWHSYRNKTLETDYGAPVFATTPNSSITALTRYDAGSGNFEVTVHYVVGGLDWGWWPSFNNPIFTSVDVGKGYYTDVQNNMVWTHEP
ncbi:MAG: hypothetical protein ABIA93_00150 [Candidatus Woesearchaeota archaeon]